MATEALAGFDSIIVALLRDDGQIKKLHEGLAQIDIYENQIEAVAKVIKGSRVVCNINLNNIVETARIQLHSLALRVDEDTYFIRCQTPKDVQSFIDSIQVIQSKKSKSTFNQRTDHSSAEQYFQFYGYLSQQQNMMQDFVRTSTYQRAMLENTIDFQDKVVLDVGAGSGILSFFAIQAGAKRVYAVEASSMAQHCENLVQANMMINQIVVIAGKIEEVEIPEYVDVIISEPMGYMLFNERMLETYLHARKWLKPGGKMFPAQGDLHITPFTDDALYLEQFSKANFWYQPSFHGVDLTGLREMAIDEYFKQPVVDTFDIRICLAKTHKYSVDFESALETDLHDINIPVSFTMQQSGSVHGLAFWFDVAFNGSQSTVWLSTAPTQPLTHWYQVRCLLQKPIFVRVGETLAGSVHLRSNARQSYDVDIELHIPGSGVTNSNTLDLKNPCFRYTGQPIQPPPGTNHTSPTDAYWNQQDATVDQTQTDVNSMTVVNGGDGSQYIQLQQPSGVYNNYLPPVAANLMASIAGINPGSIPSPAVVSLASAVQSSAIDAGRQTGFMTNNLSVASHTQFPLSNQLMIGDYVVPNNIIIPAAAQGSINLFQYKAVDQL